MDPLIEMKTNSVDLISKLETLKKIDTHRPGQPTPSVEYKKKKVKVILALEICG